MQATEEPDWASVSAEVCVAQGVARVIHYQSHRPIDMVGSTRGYRLEMRLVRGQCKSGQASFPERWQRGRSGAIGDLYLIPSDEIIHVFGPPARQSSIICEFEASSVDAWFGENLDWSSLQLASCLDIASPLLTNVLGRLAREMNSPSLASGAMSELLVAQAALALVRSIGTVREERTCGGLAGWRLRCIDERLNESGRAPSLGELAGLIGLSVRQMARAYQASRGGSIGAAIATAQATHAQTLLKNGMTVAQVADALGFAAPSSFSSAFKRATGIAPRQFREQAGQFLR